MWGGQDNKEQAVIKCGISGFAQESWQKKDPWELGTVSFFLTAGVKDAFFYKWPLSTKIRNMSINRGRELK